MSEEALSSLPHAQLSIVVDLTSTSFDFKTLYNHLSSQAPPNSDHHHWHFGGLRSYTIPFQSNHDEATVHHVISKLKLLQNHLSILPPFWISYKKCQLNTLPSPTSSAINSEIIRKNLKLARFYTNNGLEMDYSAGALVELNKYIWDIRTQIKDAWRIVFYHDKIEIDFGSKDKKMRKTLKAEMMDRCAVVMTQSNGFTLFINLTGNPIDSEAINHSQSSISNDEGKQIKEEKHFEVNTEASRNILKQFLDPAQRKNIESNVNYTRTATRESQPFYSTVRIVMSVTDQNSVVPNEFRAEQLERLNSCYAQFMDFFQRNHITDCFGIIISIPSSIDFSSIQSLFMSRQTNSFIKQYCWQMLMSIGYRFQQRLTSEFIQQMSLIEDDDEFYQVI